MNEWVPAAECLLKSTCHILQSKTKPHIQQMLSLPLPTLPPEFHPVNMKAAKGQLPSHLAEARQLSSLSNFRGNCLFSITRQDKHFKELALIFLHYCSNLVKPKACPKFHADCRKSHPSTPPWGLGAPSVNGRFNCVPAAQTACGGWCGKIQGNTRVPRGPHAKSS